MSVSVWLWSVPMSRGGAAGLLLSSVLLLGACSDGEAQAEPSNSPSLSVTATQTPTVTSTEEIVPEPTMPPEAREQTAEGAAAFAQYYLELVEFAYSTGEVATLESLASPDCEFCEVTTQNISTIYDRGGRIEGVDISISSPVATPPDANGSVVTMLYSETASRAVAADGSTINETPAVAEKAIEIYLLTSGDRWLVFGIGNVE